MADANPRRNKLEITVRIADMPEIKEALERFADKVDALTDERDEWERLHDEVEQRYEDLLAACGGVWPGA